MKTCELIAAMAVTIIGFGAAKAQDVSFGQRLFRDKADCQFCHGMNGDGRGDPRSPGRAANLHETRLNREQLIEVIACGRPGTEMPHFDKYAWFPREIIPVPRSWAERAYPNLVYFNKLEKGGHFAAWEQPELFAGEMRAAFRSLR
jgi:pimeloyl-ACP methyl ester carboxylesterase